MAVLAQSAEICYTEPERKCFPVRCDCHIHMVLDGADWKRAIARHSGGVDEAWVRRVLETYRKLGFAYLRDGGDRWGVGAKARSLAGEYGITYRTPLSPLCAQGHYGGFIGEKYENLSQYAAMVSQKRAEDADFIKIMISGLMDFDRFGVLTEDGLPPETIRELIHIAHEEGFAVMAHANGARTVRRWPGWIPWNTARIWTRTPSTPCAKTERCGCLRCPPSGICGERGALTKLLWRRFWKAPWKMWPPLRPWAA